MVSDNRSAVQTLLRGLPTRKLDALKQLFWSQLNYDRAGAVLAMAAWPAELKTLLAEPPQIFATAGDGDSFQVIYCRLSGANQGQMQPLSLGDERALVGRLLREHPYALFIFSNRAQDHWHFVNVKYEQDAEARARRVFRRISVTPYETAGPEQRLRTATERLSLLDVALLAPHLTGLSPLVIQNRHDEAFDVEAVTRDFFATYRVVFEEVEQQIQGLAGEEQRLFTQRLFNRLLFLIFLERKGWLTFGGRSDYLRALWDAHTQAVAAGDNDNFYRERLQLLFFSALNTPNEVDIVGVTQGGFVQQRIGQAPYLNGGLFEEDATDRNAAVVVPDRAVDLILQRLLYHYNFTITESTPLDVEVAVDPEMLGKIFEELVTGRHESGSYYTPKPIVAFMGQEALKGYLERACPAETPADLAVFVDARDPTGLRQPKAVLDALRRVTICDPACGSGAYLLGMLHELLALRLALAEHAGGAHQTLYEQKLEIIQNNLYGVDIDPFAVNIARLRLWLSLIVEYEGDTPPPLPNLDFKIETGASRLSPSPASLAPDMFRDQQVREFFALKSRYMQAHGGEKLTLRRQIDALRQAMRAWAHRSGQRTEGFDWVVEFAEIFSGTHQGFDIVLANPPYVRQEDIGDVQKHQLALQYGSGETYEVYDGRADLYTYFYARGMQILKAKGVLCFVTSDKFMNRGYGKKLRNVLSRSLDLKYLIDFGEVAVFKATVETCVVIGQKRVDASQPYGEVIYWEIESSADLEDIMKNARTQGWTIPQRKFGKSEWIVLRSSESDLLERIRAKGTPLGSYVNGRIYSGIKTGRNGVFVIDEMTRSQILDSDPRSDELIKRWLVGSDIEKWHLKWGNKYLIFTPHGIDMARYPAIMEFLRYHKVSLMERATSGQHQWYELQQPQMGIVPEYMLPKIVYQNVSRYYKFAFDRDSFFPDMNVFVIPVDNPFILGCMASSTMQFFAQALTGTKPGGFLVLKTMYVQQFPIPQPPQDIYATLIEIVNDLHAPQQNATHVKQLEQYLNQIVYKLFELRPADIRIIEEQTTRNADN